MNETLKEWKTEIKAFQENSFHQILNLESLKSILQAQP